MRGIVGLWVAELFMLDTIAVLQISLMVIAWFAFDFSNKAVGLLKVTQRGGSLAIAAFCCHSLMVVENAMRLIHLLFGTVIDLKSQNHHV